jgi:hypothetical protein
MGVAAWLDWPTRSCRSAEADAMVPGRQHLDAMRTTLTIDDGLLRQLRQKALDSGKPFKQVVNDTLLAGLAQPAPRPRQPYRCPTFSVGALAPGADFTKANQLAAALEDGALMEKLRQGR